MQNFIEVTQTVDGYNYNFYRPTDQKTEGWGINMDQSVAYAQMAKRFMNKPFNSPLDIVGNYEWHQKFPYEDYLFKNWDDGTWLKDPTKACVADFGGGPGRMVERANKIFTTPVDGIDISEYAIAYAREHFPQSRFYVSSGVDVGDVPPDSYHIVFSTICIQHIPVKTIRQNIFRAIHNILIPGGVMSIQVAYHPDLKAGVWSNDTEHASYDSDFWNAKATNGHADMVINKDDLPKLRDDLSQIFKNVKLNLVDVSEKYANLNGAYHAPYWAKDWLFIQGTKA